MQATIYNGTVAGLKFHDWNNIKIESGDKLELETEPNNEYDPNAIKIIHILEDIRTMIGYVPRVDTWKIMPYISSNIPIQAQVTYISRGKKNVVLINVSVDKDQIIKFTAPPAADKGQPATLIDEPTIEE